MKVGDVVIRAYAWDGIVPGIIVDEEFEIITATNEEYSYEQCNYVVQWSDGMQTRELYEELDTFLGNKMIENYINDSKGNKEYNDA